MLSYQSDSSLLDKSILNYLSKNNRINLLDGEQDNQIPLFQYVNKFSTKDSSLYLVGILYDTRYDDSELELDFLLLEKECDTFKIINDEFVSKEYWTKLKSEETKNFKNQEKIFFINWSNSILRKLNLVNDEILNDLQVYKLVYEFKRIQEAKNSLKYMFQRNLNDCSEYNLSKYLRVVKPSVKYKSTKDFFIPKEFIIKYSTKKYSSNKLKFKCKNDCANPELNCKNPDIYLNGNKLALISEWDDSYNWRDILPNYESADYYEDINNGRLFIFSRAKFTQNIGFRVNSIDIIDYKNKECLSFIINLNDKILMEEYGYIFGYDKTEYGN